MSILSYNLAYYRDALLHLESSPVTKASLYRAKQLLKFVEDIADEGYPALSERLESAFSGVQRLRSYILANGERPFPVRPEPPIRKDPAYSAKKVPLKAFLKAQTAIPYAPCSSVQTAFLEELCRFTDSLGTDRNTTYLFLLRDTFLPYLRFAGQGNDNAEAWLLGRKMMWELTEPDAEDTCVRSVINDALGQGKTASFEEFSDFCLSRIRENLKTYPAFTGAVLRLLSSIRTERITVVESGVYGTFPMLLCALDSRVDFQMFTAIPQLCAVYRGRLFTDAYEKNRSFETLASQDLFFRYAGFSDGVFTVQVSENPEIKERAFSEISAVLSFPKNAR